MEEFQSSKGFARVKTAFNLFFFFFFPRGKLDKILTRSFCLVNVRRFNFDQKDFLSLFFFLKRFISLFIPPIIPLLAIRNLPCCCAKEKFDFFLVLDAVLRMKAKEKKERESRLKINHAPLRFAGNFHRVEYGTGPFYKYDNWRRAMELAKQKETIR